MIAELWGHGITSTHKVFDGVSKQFIKGERLKFYPAGMNLYSSSRGMKRPVVEELTNKEAMVRVGDAELVYRETYDIGDENCGNFIDKRYYKTSKESITKDKIIDSKWSSPFKPVLLFIVTVCDKTNHNYSIYSALRARKNHH